MTGFSIEKQYYILKHQGFAWLDSITTQQQLADAICQLDISYSGHTIWNDMEKFAPFLVSGQYNNAQRVIQSIISQHRVALETNRAHFTSDDYHKLLEFHEKENKDLLFKLNLAHKENIDWIQGYVTQNYAINKKLTGFCFKK